MLCPMCNKLVDEAMRGKPKSPYPFCSERCKLVDLGRWLDGKYQIPAVEREAAAEDPGTDDDKQRD